MIRTILSIYILHVATILFAREINLKDREIDGSGKTEVSKVIQGAIDECYSEGGGKVIFPPGNYLSGTIFLKNNVELHIERGATLVASTDPDHLPRLQQPVYRSRFDIGGWYSLVYAEGAKNIAITGDGTIDGQGAKHKPRANDHKEDKYGRPRNVVFISCSNVTVTGVTLKNAGFWNFHLLNCEDVVVDKIKVYNHSNHNNDGIDIDGCRRVILTNSIIDSNDDAICLKSTGIAPCEDIIISHCIAGSFCNGIKMGTESAGGFRNINISNCVVKPSISKHVPRGNPHATGITGLSFEIVDGGIMEGISVNNVTIEGTECPIYVRLGGRNRNYIKGIETPETGKIRNVSISNVTAYNSGNFACSITGIPGHRVENIRLNNINIVQKGGLKTSDFLQGLDDVDEDIKGYPEPTVWGNLPVCGLFIRHVDRISVNNFSIDALQPDPRPLFMAHDVHDLVINGVRVGKNISADLPFVKKDVTDAKVEF